jgi:ABC-type oligopeptide transport system ATPase subunit
MNYANYLTNLKIDTRKVAYAIEDANKERFEDAYYVDHVKALTGVEQIARHVFLYIVEQIVVEGKPNTTKAIAKAVAFITNNPWSTVKPENVSYYVRKSEVDALGKPKQKKGAKKAIAIAFWNANMKSKDITRQSAITMLMEAVGLTKAGASTYYHNLKNGTFE